jgi:starch-binding outer membrane protein, SusD/RagB family
MKKLFIFFIVLAGSGISSCSDDFLEIQPPSSPTVTQLYQNDEDFRGALVGTYDVLQEVYRELWQLTELRADNADHRAPGWPPMQEVSNFVVNNSAAILQNTWLRLYRGVNRVNLLLEQLPASRPVPLSNATLYESEARFLRALFLYNATLLWGDVPMPLKTLVVDEAYTISRTSQAQGLEQAVADLLAAEASLPVSWPAADIGRATRGAAQSLLGKVYLTQQNWAAAEAKLREVVNSGTYALLTDFNQVFDVENKHHAEYIFDAEFLDGGFGKGSDFPIRFIPNNAGLRQAFGVFGVSGETMSPTDEFMALFEPEDTRAAISFATTYPNPDGTQSPANQPYTLKYLVPSPIAGDSKVNWKILRYADVILMLAESLNENGNTDAALTELNRIRVRAGVRELSGLSQAAARTAIADERRRELAFEGHRWYDLVRTNQVYEVMSAKGYPIREFMRLYAIPEQQIAVVNNPSILDQNPGY